MGKGANFNGGDKHCVITPKNGPQFLSISFSIPESIPSHSTDFILCKYKNVKVDKFLKSIQLMDTTTIILDNNNKSMHGKNYEKLLLNHALLATCATDYRLFAVIMRVIWLILNL